MNMKRVFTVGCVVALLFAGAGTCFAGGGGGVTFGTQWFDFGYANLDLDMTSIGGFGYGVSHDGERIGGFGMAMFGQGPSGGLAGGVGGMINGWEVRLRPITVALNLWTGLGGMGFDAPGDSGGYMVGFAELSLEVCVSITRWMRFECYAGYQVMGNFLPGDTFSSLLVYTPVVGGRVTWGSM
jgi:hypothetical protein